MSQILDSWNEIKVLVDQIELDVVKSDKGISIAGTRLRKGLRQLKKDVTNLIRVSATSDRAARATKTSTRKPLTPEQKAARAVS